jgi:flagellar biosynthetic protein FlhB
VAEDSDLEKTEEASAKRLEKAREEGDVPRSRELATCTVLLAAGVGFSMLGQPLNAALKSNMTGLLQLERQAAFDPAFLLNRIADSIFSLLIAFAPLALLIMIVAIASPALIGGWLMSGKALIPKFSKLNPINGLSNLVSKNSAVEIVKSIAKSVLVGTVAYLVITANMDHMLTLSQLRVDEAIGATGSLMLKAFLMIVGSLILIAVIDVPYQLKHYADKLKMTKEEVKQEAKESEGNPQIKARIRQQQREMARRRMMSEIPKADVVITNPTHYAVAIQYADGSMRAPKVIAKGADAVALKIREIAREHQVMTLESPKLARALYAHTELGDEIPETLYAAVAEVLAYVFQMRIFRKDGGLMPSLSSQLDIPKGLDPHEVEGAGQLAGANA